MDQFRNASGSQSWAHRQNLSDDRNPSRGIFTSAPCAFDTRLPRGRHNDQAGTLGPDEYDYGMFDFVEAFVDAGPGAAANGEPDYDRFTHDFTDHMPIWVRLPIPKAGQTDFSVSG